MSIFMALLFLFVHMPLIYACQHSIFLVFASAFTTMPLLFVRSNVQGVDLPPVRVGIHSCCHCHEMCSNKLTWWMTCVVEFALSVRRLS